MLEIIPTNDAKLLADISVKCLDRPFLKSVGYVLFEDGFAVGIADLTIKADGAYLTSLGIIPQRRGRGLGDFFTRSLLFHMSNVAPTITVYDDDYFLQFGFTKRGNELAIKSTELNFPRKCCT